MTFSVRRYLISFWRYYVLRHDSLLKKVIEGQMDRSEENSCMVDQGNVARLVKER